MDEKAFTAFFAACFDDVWRFVRRRTTSSAEADDVTAEAFAVAWRRHAEIPDWPEARLWVFGAARNILANQRREVTRRGRLQLRLVATGEVAAAYEPGEPSDAVLWRALAALSSDDRELLLLRGWDELSVAEMATLLRLEPATVSSRLYKARQRLEKNLADLRRDPDAAGHVSDEPVAERRWRR